MCRRVCGREGPPQRDPQLHRKKQSEKPEVFRFSVPIIPGARDTRKPEIRRTAERGRQFAAARRLI